MMTDPAVDIPGVVDVQPSLMPGGELPVPGGQAVVPLTNALLRRFPDEVATQNSHPPAHGSFVSTRPGHEPGDAIETPASLRTLRPDHAIPHSAGAAPHPDLDAARFFRVIGRGYQPATDTCSAFRNSDRASSTALAGWRRARSITRVLPCSPAVESRVAWSAEDPVAAGVETIVVQHAACPIGLPGPNGTNTASFAQTRPSGRREHFVPAHARQSRHP